MECEIKNKKKTILIVHNYYQIPGGEDSVVANEKKLLEEHGHRVILYSRNNSEIKKMTIRQKLLIPVTTIFNLKTYREIKKLISNQKIDIVHVHNTLNLISPSVYYASVSMHIPVVQTIHNFRLLCPSATFYRNDQICEDCVKDGLWCAIKHRCYRGSTLQTVAYVISTKIHRMIGIYRKINYICLTEFNKKKLLSLKQIKESRVFIKPNFAESELDIVHYKQRKNQFVFVGRLDKLKGIDFLLKIWKQIEKKGAASKLVICGTGPMEEWCRTYIAENNLQSVEMLGFVANKEAKRIISNSKALILPTQWYEGFPMTIVEAYSVGTPVIGSNIGNVGDLIHDGKTGYKFDIDSNDELEDVITNQNFDLCEEVKKEYNYKFGKEENYQKLINVYNIIYS